MTPLQARSVQSRPQTNDTVNGNWRQHATANALILEAWSEGCMFGALMIMICVTVANMRKGVLLHKLILLELLLAVMHATFCFMSFHGYGWYVSSTAALLYCSWIVHNIVAWIKIRPFFEDPRSLFPSRAGGVVGKVYIISLVMTIPPTVLQMVLSFLYFNNINDLYVRVRPIEPAFRDPWWISTCLALFHVIRKCYGFSVLGMIGRSPRLGILLTAICLAMVFTLMDVLASAIPRVNGPVDGINPYWKLALIFKCLTDNIMLDDFSSELKKIANNSTLDLPTSRPHKRACATFEEKQRDTPMEIEHPCGQYHGQIDVRPIEASGRDCVEIAK